jgi:hypothetical protein
VLGVALLHDPAPDSQPDQGGEDQPGSQAQSV